MKGRYNRASAIEGTPLGGALAASVRRQMQASATCQTCGRSDSVSVWQQDWDKYMGGELVQNVWGYFDADKREVLRGARAGHYFCPPCFDNLHSIEEES